MVAVATAIAVLDVFFILVAVPESLPAQQPKKDGSKPAPARGLTLEQVDDLQDQLLIVCASCDGYRDWESHET